VEWHRDAGCSSRREETHTANKESKHPGNISVDGVAFAVFPSRAERSSADRIFYSRRLRMHKCRSAQRGTKNGAAPGKNKAGSQTKHTKYPIRAVLICVRRVHGLLVCIYLATYPSERTMKNSMSYTGKGGNVRIQMDIAFWSECALVAGNGNMACFELMVIWFFVSRKSEQTYTGLDFAANNMIQKAK